MKESSFLPVLLSYIQIRLCNLELDILITCYPGRENISVVVLLE